MIAFVWCDQFDRELRRDHSGTQFIRLLEGRCSPLDVRISVAADCAVDAIVILGKNSEQMIRTSSGLFARKARSRSREKSEKDSATAAGELVAVAYSKGVEVGKTRLLVLPANFSPTEYQVMLLEIGLAAVSSASWIQGSVSASGVTAADGFADAGLALVKGKSSRVALLACIDTIEHAMPAIIRRPIVDLRPILTRVPRSRAGRSARGLQAIVRNPGKPTMQVMTLEESLDSVENQYLRWIIERMVRPLVYLEMGRAPAVEPQDGEDIQTLLYRAAKKNPRIEDLAGRVRAFNARASEQVAAVTELQKAQRKVDSWLSLAPVRSASVVHTRPAPTERLIGAPGYRSVFSAIERLQLTLGGTVVRGLAIADAIIRREISATWRCYETWCYVQIVNALAITAGFRTPSGQQTLGEMIEVVAGEVRIPRGNRLILERGALRAELIYEPRLRSIRDGKGELLLSGFSELTPDILLSLQRNQTTQKNFIFDAKYRNYAVQGITAKTEDLSKTAILKYLNGVNGFTGDGHTRVSGSFILHSDPKTRESSNDYWGGVAPEFWLPGGAVDQPEEAWHGTCGHSCGLMRLRPDSDRDFQMGRLLDMLIQYHLREPASFECSRCGTTLAPGTDVRLESSRIPINDLQHEVNYVQKALRQGWATSVVCLCPGCSNLWFENHCRANGHRLFKQGHRSYHHPSQQSWDTTGMYICPECGDDPSPGDFSVPMPVASHEFNHSEWGSDFPEDDLPY